MVAQITSALPDNNTQAISPEDIRLRLLEMVDSFALINETSAPWVELGAKNITDYGGTADGVADDTSALAATDAAAVAAGVVVLVTGIQRIRVTANTVLAAGLAIERGGGFVIDAGVTLTLNGPVQAGDNQIFYGSGSVLGSSFGSQAVRPYWWGVATNGTTASDAPMLASMACAAHAGVPLTARRDQRIVFATANNRVGPFTGAKHLILQDVYFYSAYMTANGPILDIRPDTFPRKSTVNANAAVRDTTLTVVSTASLVAGNRYCLISKKRNKQALGADATSCKSEFVTIQSIDSATQVTLNNGLLSSYLTADWASLFNTTWDHQVTFDNVTVERLDGSLTKDGIYCTFCKVNRSPGNRVIKTGVWGFQFKICSSFGAFDCTGYGTPSGYVCGSAGCDNFEFGDISGRGVRHTLTMDGDGVVAGKSWDIGDTTLVAPTGRGGRFNSVHCIDAENAIFDMHPGHIGVSGGSVTGNVRADASAATAVMLESTNVSIDRIDVCGPGISVPYYGLPADEAQAFYRFGSIKCFAKTTANVPLLNVYNRDTTNKTAVSAHVDELDGSGGGFLNLTTVTDAGGDIFMSYGRLQGEARFANTVLLQTGANGRIECVGNRADLSNPTATGYCVYALASTYTAAHAGVHGARFVAREGSLYEKYSGTGTEYAVRATDGLIELGPRVTWSTDSPGNVLLDFQSGIGGVIGSDKVLTTINTNAAFTLTPYVHAEEVRHTGTLTADRALTLSTTGVRAGAKFRLTRTGGGAFNITHALKNLATNQWAEFCYDGSAWYLAAFGSL